MNLFKLLKEDHAKFKSLLKELEDTSERSVKTREHLFANLRMDLTVHSEAEEKFFYPRIIGAEETREITLEGIEEHNVMKALLAELDVESKATEEWAAKLKVLRENLEHHIKEEEGEMFKSAKSVLSDEDIESIGVEIEDYKEEYSELEERA